MARIRLTRPTLKVLKVLLESRPDDPAWGLRICEEAGLGSGTVYPILDRLAAQGWLTSRTETGPHPGRPPRRYYELSGAGRALATPVLTTRHPRRCAPRRVLG
ncbi:PadR family transcriptional regulator [Streptomyces sp. NPDC059063]|uniref:PadR family transcriptional regulator n=1 Tax=unclassified Streptomyces TaxID=2593676 RepID=UPI0036CA1E8E